jgi:superfamily II DNA or RNA helicase
MSLRDYQVKAVDEIRQHYRRGVKKVLLHLATGGGKTLIFCFIAKGTIAKGKRVLIVVRGRKLIDQASERLSREGVDHGIIMAGREISFNKSCYVCSIDTLISRKDFPPVDLVIIDEAHQASSKGYIDFAAAYADKFILGVTATPYGRKSLRHIADKIVAPISVGELIAQGHLVGPKYFAPSQISRASLKIGGNGDFTEKSMMDECNKVTIVGGIVENWIKNAHKRPTLVFCINVEHSKNIEASFEAFGVKALHIDATTPDDERLDAIQKLESGKIDVLTNCGILCTGVDIPAVSCIVLARPTASEILYIQQVGRGTRLHPGKTDFLVFDHACNIEEHGFVETDREGRIDPPPKRKKKPDDLITFKRCPECQALNTLSAKNCNNCLFVFRGQDEVISGKDQLEEITIDKHIRRFVEQKAKIGRANGYKREWLYHQIKRRFGADIAKKLVPWRPSKSNSMAPPRPQKILSVEKSNRRNERS